MTDVNYWDIKEINSQRFGSRVLSAEDVKALPTSVRDQLFTMTRSVINGSPVARQFLSKSGGGPLVLEFNGKSLQIVVQAKTASIADAKEILTGGASSYWASVKKISEIAEQRQLGTTTEEESFWQQQIADANIHASCEKQRQLEAGRITSPFSRNVSRLEEINDAAGSALSVVRNAIVAIKDPKDAIFFKKTSSPWLQTLGGIGLISGGLGVGTGLISLKRGFHEGVAAKNLGNQEQMGITAVNVMGGTSSLVTGSLGVTQDSARFASASHIVSLVGMPLMIFAFVGYACSILAMGYKLIVACKFRAQMNSKESLYESLMALRQQITISPLEAMEITAKANLANKDPREELSRCEQKKWAQFELRVGRRVCCELREKLTLEFFDRLKTGDEAAIQESKGMLERTSRANFLQIASRVGKLAITLIGMSALICAIVFSGPLSPILFGIAAGLSLLNERRKIQQVAGQKFWALRNAVCGKKQEDAACLTTDNSLQSLSEQQPNMVLDAAMVF